MMRSVTNESIICRNFGSQTEHNHLVNTNNQFELFLSLGGPQQQYYVVRRILMNDGWKTSVAVVPPTLPSRKRVPPYLLNHSLSQLIDSILRFYGCSTHFGWLSSNKKKKKPQETRAKHGGTRRQKYGSSLSAWTTCKTLSQYHKHSRPGYCHFINW